MHAQRPYLKLADVEQSARRRSRGEPAGVISPIVLEAVRRLDALFEIERAINGQSTEHRRAVRQELSAPLVANLKTWMREQRPKLSRGTDPARAMDCMLKRWRRLAASWLMGGFVC
uniref:IS66 family transposase n=1 Tax=Lichenicoccus roseus TaxID=2683649 RepID=UPI0014874551